MNETNWDNMCTGVTVVWAPLVCTQGKHTGKGSNNMYRGRQDDRAVLGHNTN